MNRYSLSLVAVGAAVLIPSVSSAQPSASNYRQYAVCKEELIAGRWFHTFGEGRCPPGSRRELPTTRANSGDPNVQTMRTTERKVQALTDMQQSLLALGKKIGERYKAESDKRAETYNYHPLIDETIDTDQLYSARKIAFPLPGTLIYARRGDPIMTTSDGFTSACFVSLQEGEAKQIGGHRHHVVPGELVCKLKPDDKAYTPLYANYISSNGEMSMGQALVLKDGSYKICYRNMGMNAMCVKDVPMEKVIETVGLVELQNTSKEVAHFNRLEDGKLFVVSTSGDSNETDLVFDLNVSKEFAIDGLEFEVLEASAEEIVLRRKSTLLPSK